MVIKQTKSRVKQKMTENPSSSSAVSGKHADLKMRNAGLNLLLLAEKKAQEGWGSSTASSSSPESLSLTSAKTVSLTSVPARTGSVEKSEMSNSALLQLAEMCTSELHSTSKDNRMSPACTGVQYKLNSSTVAESALPQFHATSSLGWHDIVSPPEKRAYHWSLTTEAVSACSSLTTSSKGEDIDICSKNSRLSPQDSSVIKLGYTSMESPWSSDDKYASNEKYRSSSSRRKLSSSATESIPSPSSSFGDETEEDGMPVFLSQLEQSRGHTFSVKEGDLDQANLHCSFTLGYSSKLVSDGTTQSRHNQRSHQHPSPALQRYSTHQEQFVKHLAASTSTMSRPHALKEAETTTAHDKQSSYTFRQNLHHPTNTLQISEINDDKNVNTHSENRCYPNFHKWREPVNLVKKLGETSATSEPPSKIVREDYSPVIKVNFTEWRQQRCSEWQCALGKPGYECDNSPAQTHSLDFKSSTACHVSSTKTASLLSEGRLASLLSRTETSRDKFLLGVSEAFHSKPGTDREVNHSNTTCFNEPQARFSKLAEPSIPDLQLPSSGENSYGKVQSLPGHVVGAGAVSLTFAHQGHTFSKGKLKKKWTERMLVEAKLKHQAEINGVCQEAGLTVASIDACSVSNINTSHQHEPKSELSILTTANDGVVVGVELAEHPNEMKTLMNFDTKSSGNMQAKLSMNPPPALPRHPPDTSKAEFGHINEPTSFNASRHPKLLFQLSQNHQFFKPDHLKLQASVGNAQMKSEQDASSTNPQRGQHLISFDHQHAMGDLSMKHDAGDGKRDICSIDSNYKINLNPITACGKRMSDHIIKQLRKTDFSVDPQQCPENFSRDRDSPAVTVKSEAGQETSGGRAWMKEETCDRLVKSEDQMDFSVMTASSLVEKVIKKWRDGCCTNNKVDRVNINGRDVELGEGGNTTLSLDSSTSNLTTADGCHDNSMNGETSKTFSGEANLHSVSVSAATEPSDHADITDHISPKPIRKSRRANRGKIYQELIKEGVIQPSRERLAARNAEKFGTDAGDLAQEEITPLPVYSLELPIKRKTRRRLCDSEILETVEAGHMTNTEIPPCPSLGSSSTKASSSGPGLKLKVETLGTGYPTPQIALPTKHLPMQPVTGSQKRKARKHCITRISILKEVKETVNSQCLVPHKKPCKKAS